MKRLVLICAVIALSSSTSSADDLASWWSRWFVIRPSGNLSALWTPDTIGQSKYELQQIIDKTPPVPLRMNGRGQSCWPARPNQQLVGDREQAEIILQFMCIFRNTQ